MCLGDAVYMQTKDQLLPAIEATITSNDLLKHITAPERPSRLVNVYHQKIVHHRRPLTAPVHSLPISFAGASPQQHFPIFRKVTANLDKQPITLSHSLKWPIETDTHRRDPYQWRLMQIACRCGRFNAYALSPLFR